MGEGKPLPLGSQSRQLPISLPGRSEPVSNLPLWARLQIWWLDSEGGNHTRSSRVITDSQGVHVRAQSLSESKFRGRLGRLRAREGPHLAGTPRPLPLRPGILLPNEITSRQINTLPRTLRVPLPLLGPRGGPCYVTLTRLLYHPILHQVG